MNFGDSAFSSIDGKSFYLTVTIDLMSNTVEAFNSAKSVGKNICEENYLDKDIICDETIPFTIGMMVAGDVPQPEYTPFKLYGCRLYDRVLSNEEIEKNYENSKNLLNDSN